MDDALAKPIHTARKYPYHGKQYTLKELLKFSKVSKRILVSRLFAYKWPVERAVDTPKQRKRGMLFDVDGG